MGSTRTYLLAFTVAMIAIMITAPHGAAASDPDQLQDFCVADLSPNATIVNGYPCIPPGLVTANDFWLGKLATPSNLTGNVFNGSVKGGAVGAWPAVNTLGVSLARLDINPGGVILPHTHNLATEVVFCLEGEIFSAFVTNSGNPSVPNKLYGQTIKQYEAALIPRGLLHFQVNYGAVKAVSINFLNSQNPGFQLMNTALFGAGIDPAVLAKSFFIPLNETEKLESILSQVATQIDGAFSLGG